MFRLKNKNRLKTDYCPVFVIGKYHTAPIIFFGVNPGYSSKNSPIEENEASKSWEHYQNLYLNFFNTFHVINLNHTTILLYGISFLD